MNFIDNIKGLIPRYHCVQDEDGFINMGLTWIDDTGLEDRHWATIKFHRNNETLALKLGEEQPDGSMVYVTKFGATHRISGEKVKAMVKLKQEKLNELQGILSKVGSHGPTLDVAGASA